jgi:hypothetical protein
MGPRFWDPNLGPQFGTRFGNLIWGVIWDPDLGGDMGPWFFRDVIAGYYCRTWLREGDCMELLRGIIVGPSGFAERYIIAGWLRGIIVGPSGFAERYIIAGWLRGVISGCYCGALLRDDIAGCYRGALFRDVIAGQYIIIEGWYCGTLSRGIIAGPGGCRALLRGVIAGHYWGTLLKDVIAGQGFAARFCVMLLQDNIAGWISWEFLWGVIAGWLRGSIEGRYCRALYRTAPGDLRDVIAGRY